MTDHQLLELYLFSALPRVDVNPLVYRLMDRFGTLYGVLNAPEEALRAVSGVGDSVVCSLRLAGDLFRRSEESRVREAPITSRSGAEDVLAPLFLGIATERLYLLCLDGGGRVLSQVLLAEGGASEVRLQEEDVLAQLSRCHPASILLAHNHPGGDPTPSREDIAATQALSARLTALNVTLLDHLIWADGVFFSLREQGFLETN